MKLIRYTFAGKGLFHAMNLLDNVKLSYNEEADLIEAEREIEEYLAVPDVCTMLAKVKCYFTEAGVKRFDDSIDAICYYMNNKLADIGKVEKEEVDCPENKTIYLDQYQAVLTA